MSAGFSGRPRGSGAALRDAAVSFLVLSTPDGLGAFVNVLGRSHIVSPLQMPAVLRVSCAVPSSSTCFQQVHKCHMALARERGTVGHSLGYLLVQ